MLNFAESGPPSERGELFDYFVPIELSLKELVDAIGDWETALMTVPCPIVRRHYRTVFGTVVPCQLG